jgi:anti-sigma B factor antagonist
MNVELATRREGATTAVVSVGGEIDNETAPALRDELSAAYGDGVERVVVDLSSTRFLDSSALGALVGANKEHGAQGRLVIVCPDPQLRKVFEISRLNEVFPVHTSLDDALGS